MKGLIFVLVALAAFGFTHANSSAAVILSGMALFAIWVDVREQAIRRLQQQENDDASR